MLLKPRSRIRNKTARWLHKALNWLENESDANLHTNGEYAFLKSLIEEKGASMVIFDVGANTGEYGDIAYNLLPQDSRDKLRLHSFEPIAPFVGHGTLVKAIVSDIDGALIIHKRQDDDISSVHRQEWLDRKYGPAEEVSVQSIRLDSYIEKNSIKHIDLLKIDVEGHELNVLKGCGKYLNTEFISAIQFEYGLAAKASGVFFQTIHSLLTSKGYRVYKVFPKHLELATLDWAESIEYANFVAMK